MEAKEIIQHSISYLGITMEEFNGPTRGLKKVSDSRHMIIFLIKSTTCMSNWEMTKLINRHRSSIMRSLIKFESFYNQEESFRNEYLELNNHINKKR